MNLPSMGGAPSTLGAALSDAQTRFNSLGGELLSRLKAALSIGQATRLLQLETSLSSGSLVVERCHITESVHANEPLWAELDCLSTNAFLELKALTGEQLTLRLMRRPAGRRRRFCPLPPHAGRLDALARAAPRHAHLPGPICARHRQRRLPVLPACPLQV